jgi:hypothetical protein
MSELKIKIKICGNLKRKWNNCTKTLNTALEFHSQLYDGLDKWESDLGDNMYDTEEKVEQYMRNIAKPNQGNSEALVMDSPTPHMPPGTNQLYSMLE